MAKVSKWKFAGGRAVTARRVGDKWYDVSCKAYPALAAQYEGAESIVELLDEIERRAAAPPAGAGPACEVLWQFNPPVTIFLPRASA